MEKKVLNYSLTSPCADPQVQKLPNPKCRIKIRLQVWKNLPSRWFYSSPPLCQVFVSGSVKVKGKKKYLLFLTILKLKNKNNLMKQLYVYKAGCLDPRAGARAVPVNEGFQEECLIVKGCMTDTYKQNWPLSTREKIRFNSTWNQRGELKGH